MKVLSYREVGVSNGIARIAETARSLSRAPLRCGPETGDGVSPPPLKRRAITNTVHLRHEKNLCGKQLLCRPAGAQPSFLLLPRAYAPGLDYAAPAALQLRFVCCL